ncbi:YiiG family protein [Termitidicoccus mucosus]|uniref:DUF3829 domain-containing protein n=1 Tax=Termitidicoccus mucosus TaxID=1184151 RepID=A0A178INM0_9BACT|nr:hypothetical protein AW736_02880 [Opitutaceae bacterium TSB47]
MKKLSALLRTLAALALACPVLILTGCGKNAKSASGPSRHDDAAPPAGGDEGESAVAFYNSFLGFRGVSQSIFEKVGEALETCEKAVEGGMSGSDRLVWNGVIPSNSQITKIPAYQFGAPSGFAKNNKNYINPRIETVKQDVAALLKEIETLQTYYKAEDYKSDWHKKFLMARPRIENLMTRIAKTNKEVYKLADTLSEETDRKNIAKSPDGAFILNMRHAIDKARDRADLILDNGFEDTRYGLGVSDEERRQMIAKAAPICDKFDALTKELDDMCAKYKTADKKVIKGTQAEKVYDGFFASHEKSDADMRRIIRELRENGYTNDQQTVGDSVGALIKAHNEFLKSRGGK